MAPLMTTGGELRPGTAYLMGHYAAAEKIYRQDPAVMLYTPLPRRHLKRRAETE
jgi:hypothetical protein